MDWMDGMDRMGQIEGVGRPDRIGRVKGRDFGTPERGGIPSSVPRFRRCEDPSVHGVCRESGVSEKRFKSSGRGARRS